ncbi:MAG TPA: protein translocase subunit SecF [Thermoanaerobaculales bacterium]|nr:protein translocase subunit SecF [Thermoanaerobaculales bacterium]
MRIIGETHIPFLSYRRIAITASAIVVGAGLVWLVAGFLSPGIPGLRFGIDFTGGTQVLAKFRDAPDLDRLRSSLAAVSPDAPIIQRYDEAEKNEVLIRVQNPSDEEGDLTRPIIDHMVAEFNADVGRRFDLNTQGSQALALLLADADPDRVAAGGADLAQHYSPMAEAVLDYRKSRGIFRSLDELAGIPELSPAARSAIRERAAVGSFALLGVESVGPAVGADLKKAATMAIALSLLGMLVYVWVRFQLPYGIGAVVALFHDVITTLTALMITQREINLPTVAALLTLVGFSVNDTVVIFDRVRENLRLRRGERLEDIMDLSINQTLSRTFITSGTVLMVVLPLFIFGGEVINTFAFVLLVGLFVGVYSTVFVASPVALWISRLLTARREQRRSKGRR